jgi:hypothetical protein
MSTPEELFGKSIDANRQLKETVENKVGEYDSKVQQLNSLATTKMSQMESDLATWKSQASNELDDKFKESNDIYLDQLENGWAGIQAELKQGKLNVIHLNAGETYIVNSSLYAYSCEILFAGRGINAERTNLPIILTQTTNNDNYNSLVGEISLHYGSNIRFQSCLIKTSNKSNDALPWSNRNSLINISNTGSGTGAVSLYYSDIDVAPKTGLIRNHVGANIDIGWYHGVISGQGFISSNNNINGTVRLALYGIGFENGAKGLATGSIVGQNVLTNYTGEHLQ